MHSIGNELKNLVECSDCGSTIESWTETWGAMKDTEWHHKRKRKKLFPGMEENKKKVIITKLTFQKIMNYRICVD